MLMKKISLLLVGVLALFSCEQEGLDNIMEISDVEQVKTRTAGSIADRSQTLILQVLFQVLCLLFQSEVRDIS